MHPTASPQQLIHGAHRRTHICCLGSRAEQLVLVTNASNQALPLVCRPEDWAFARGLGFRQILVLGDVRRHDCVDRPGVHLDWYALPVAFGGY